VCIVGWLLGIGDRHADNLIITLKSGKSIAIDFGYAFGGASALAIPEISPFRFTPQIQALLYPFKTQGPFKVGLALVKLF
jgi:DNA-dependent protein kinase catalytic subunit